MKNFVRKGNSIDYSNGTAAAIVSGQFIPVGSLFGVAQTDIAIGDTGAVLLEGVFAVAKDGNAISQGAKVYWVTASSWLTTTATGNTFAGFAADAALAGDTTVNILLANGI